MIQKQSHRLEQKGYFTGHLLLKLFGAGGDFRDRFIGDLAQGLEHSRAPPPQHLFNEWTRELMERRAELQNL